MKMELRRPISWINWTALLAAKDSRITTDEGVGILFDKAASTSPLELRIITPIPASCKSSNMAPSKFVFTCLGSGGFHTGFLGCCCT